MTALRMSTLSRPTLTCQNHKFYEELLVSCYSLQKASLKKLTLSNKLNDKFWIQNGQTLQVLNISNCMLRDIDSIQKIVANCVELREINLNNLIFMQDSFEYMAENLTPKVKRLSIRNPRYFLFDKSINMDELITSLINRCNKLTSLNLRGNFITNNSLTSIIQTLEPTLEELDVSHTSINFEKLVELRCMKKLRTLNCWHLESHVIDVLKTELPRLCINEDDFEVAESDKIYEPEDGFWEIEAKQLQLNHEFHAKNNSEGDDS